ncbi:hypothetical protein PRO82_001342 [Candidatus Protochlamydia amoebophila]|nr:hypothetical protein [Candidatus Protochlamydia amoebophila]
MGFPFPFTFKPTSSPSLLTYLVCQIFFSLFGILFAIPG